MPLSRPWGEARNLLCVRLDAMGDVLMTTPAIRALKESAAGRRITLLTSSGGAGIAKHIPEVDDVIGYDAPWIKATTDRMSAQPEYQVVRRLRKMRFDGAVIFTVYSQSPLPAALLCRLAEIPLRAAYCRENPYQLLTDWVRDPEPENCVRHECRRQLSLAAAIGSRTGDERMSLRVEPSARERVAAMLREYGIREDRPWAVVHPGASAPSRRYPPELFAAACSCLTRTHGWRLVFTGSRDEQALVDSIRDLRQDISLAGRLQLNELAGLLSLTPVLISNNTGPVHIAAAVGTPVVDLYALTNPQHTPWMVPNRVLSHDVPCRNCYRSVCPEGHQNCLRLVAPGLVVRSALDLAEETNALRTAVEAT